MKNLFRLKIDLINKLIQKEKEGILMLKIKKSHRDNSYIVYNAHNFSLHTHTYHKRIAILIKNNVEHHRVPKSNNLRLLQSHVRVSNNRQYIRLIEEKINKLLSNKNSCVA